MTVTEHTIQTGTVRTGIADDARGAVIPPLYLTTNFRFEEIGKEPEFDYTRSNNPTRRTLTDLIAGLEGGTSATATSSGMSAVTLVLQLLKPGDLVVMAHDCYGGTLRLLTALASKGHFDLVCGDLTRADSLASLFEREPRLIWAETPSNPLLRLTDLKALVAGAREIDAITVVDNTLLSPARQRPLDFGIDIALHSTTKFINGHSDVIGGAVATRSAELGEELDWWANALGITQSPFDCYLALRGARTLFARMNQHEDNGRAIAGALRGHPAVTAVHYPGLPDDPGHELALEQQSGFGSMVSFELAGGREALDDFTGGLRHFTLAESLGGVESLISHPATMSHGAVEARERSAAGIEDGLLRISAGIEATEDLTRDIERALALVTPGVTGPPAGANSDQGRSLTAAAT